jgi:hypothetical protein
MDKSHIPVAIDAVCPCIESRNLMSFKLELLEVVIHIAISPLLKAGLGSSSVSRSKLSSSGSVRCMMPLGLLPTHGSKVSR